MIGAATVEIMECWGIPAASAVTLCPFPWYHSRTGRGTMTMNRQLDFGARVLLGTSVLALALVALPAEAGPFGFEMGMTIEQVRRVVKLEPVDGKGRFLARTAPKPHPAFEAYALAFSPTTGLAKVIALGKDIETKDTGLELRRAFDDLRQSLDAKYGNGERTDLLTAGSTMPSPSWWMLKLNAGEQVLEGLWKASDLPLPDNLRSILLRAEARSLSQGILVLSYEFTNYTDLKAAEDEAL